MAKKIVKPTPTEQVIIDERLRKQYPQMYEPGWLKGTDKKLKTGVKTLRTKRVRKKVKTKKEFKTVRTKQIEDQLGKAGLTEKEIASLRGKK